MKKYLSILLVILLSLSLFVACETDSDDDRKSSSSKDKTDTKSAVMTYVYDYDSIDELERADSPSELDEKKWKSAAKFDLASQWIFDLNGDSDSFGANVCKIVNTSKNDMSVDLSFKFNNKDEYDMTAFIDLNAMLMDSDNTVVAENSLTLFDVVNRGYALVRATIPAGETYYLTIMQRTVSHIVDAPTFSDKPEYDYSEDHTHAEEYSYDGDLGADVEFSTGVWVGDAVSKDEVYTAIYDPSYKVEYSTGIYYPGGNIEFGSDFNYEEYTFIYVNPDVEIEYSTANKVPLDGSQITITPPSLSFAFKSQVYLTCTATKIDSGNVGIDTESGDYWQTEHETYPGNYWETELETYPGDYWQTEHETYPGYIANDPGSFSYSDCYETVYVNNPDSEVALRNEHYEMMGSVAHGTELIRTAISTDDANHWSRVLYNDETYYVATRYLTTMGDPDEGFVDVDKTAYVSSKVGSLNIRNLPSFEGTVVGYAVAGEPITVIAENEMTGWFKILFTDYNGYRQTGYISSNAEYYERIISYEEATTETW